MSATSPGAGSSTSVRSVCSARRSLRYCTSSAWQRRQRSTWRRVTRSSSTEPSAASDSSSATSSHRTFVALLVSWVSTLREKLFPQLLASAVQADLGGRLGDAELGGDGLVGQVVDVTQDDDGPQARRELAQRNREAVAGGVAFGLRLR